jgi:threonine synthase
MFEQINVELKNNSVKYYSTNLKSPEITFSEALLKGIAPDGGLYLPDSFPFFTNEELESFSGKEYHELAFIVLNSIIGDEIRKEDLFNICRDAYDFEVPLEKVYNRKYILRLDRGPTASFKDFAARMMSRLMQYYLSINNQHLTILTATSGDTGSAVANAFYGLKNINVIILFPGDEVTLTQRKQMTTLTTARDLLKWPLQILHYPISLFHLQILLILAGYSPNLFTIFMHGQGCQSDRMMKLYSVYHQVILEI